MDVEKIDWLNIRNPEIRKKHGTHTEGSECPKNLMRKSNHGHLS
jgi:hypothetical protein